MDTCIIDDTYTYTIQYIEIHAYYTIHVHYWIIIK
nr:MAG TPA: hypothetical protein [Caudoviricetes sp.]